MKLKVSPERVAAFVWKESIQIVRDPSSILMAFVLPMLLLFLFGYGISLDLNEIKIGVVYRPGSVFGERLYHALDSAAGFEVLADIDPDSIRPLLVGSRIKALVVIPDDMDSRILRGLRPMIQVIINGTDSNTAELVKNYIEGVLAGLSKGKTSPVRIETRIWYNEDAKTRVSLIPGSIAVIMTMIGTMLTSLVIAREWERGTMESLLATPVTRMEFMLGKFIPYFALGMGTMGLITLLSVNLLGIPLRGSIWVLVLATASYLTFATGLGLLISSVAQNQFLATQAALIVGFLPAFILSGLVFEIDSMPFLLRMATYLFPPRYFVATLRTIFLVGDVWEIVIPNMAVLTGFGTLLILLAIKKLKYKIG